MQSITFEKVSLIPKIVEIINKINVCGGAIVLHPCVQTQDTAKAFTVVVEISEGA